MTEKELLRLKKSELLEIMLAQSKEIDSLRAQLAEAKAKLEDRRIRIQESGSIAEASLKLTQIFEEAQKAADLYVENVKRSAEKTQEAEQQETERQEAEQQETEQQEAEKQATEQQEAENQTDVQ